MSIYFPNAYKMGTKISTTQAYCKVYFKKKEKENTMATYRVNIIYILAFLLITQLIPLLWGSISQFSSVAQLSPTLCDPVNRSTPGLPVHHQLPEFTQTRVHWVGWCHPAISTSVVPFSYCPQALLYLLLLLLLLRTKAHLISANLL